MKPTNRSYTVGIRVKPAERRYLEREAAERGLRLSEYVRAILLPQGITILSDGKINA